MSLESLIDLLSIKPRERFEINSDPGYTIWDLGCEYEINPDEFLSMGEATPFEGMKVTGRCVTTIYDGKIVYEDESFKL